ncbi:MAG: hypothetical protein IT382_17195 [Deltaproteobacteria bacterium]|nr:hypothetical protein [Deltaproteobacteria bacterium]
MYRSALVIALAISCFHGSARADTIKYCLSTWADFADSGVPLTNGTTEDNWTNPSAPQKLRGARTVIYNTSQVFFDGFHGTEAEVTSTGSTKKFVVTHEFGNNVIRFATTMPNGSCAYSVPPGSACSSTDSHNIGSKEYQGCAFDEGGAHFYSADIWNNHNETDCSFKYYKNTGSNPAQPVIDCEASPADYSSGMSYPVNYLESICPSPFAGMGVEGDWLRAFWDVHTNQSTDPTFNDIKNWWDTSDGWTDTTVYSALNSGDENYPTIDPVWESIAALNGVNP